MRVVADTERSPYVYFLIVALVFAPFPVVGAFVHIPGLPKNAPVTDFVAALIPAAVALALTYRDRGAGAALALLRRVVDYRRITARIWYLPILLLSPLIYLATYGLIELTGVEFVAQPRLSVTTMLVFALIFFVAAAGEELGWSGYAIDPLQRRWGALGGALVLGVIWFAFHIPSMLQSGQDATLVGLGAFATVGLRVLWVWIFDNTGGSVFAIVVAHTVANVCASAVPSVPTNAAAPVIVVAAVLVAWLWGPKTLAHFKYPVGARSSGEE